METRPQPGPESCRVWKKNCRATFDVFWRGRTSSIQARGEGLRAEQRSVAQGMSVKMPLLFDAGDSTQKLTLACSSKTLPASAGDVPAVPKN